MILINLTPLFFSKVLSLKIQLSCHPKHIGKRMGFRNSKPVSYLLYNFKKLYLCSWWLIIFIGKFKLFNSQPLIAY